MEMSVSWGDALSGLIDVYRRFRVPAISGRSPSFKSWPSALYCTIKSLLYARYTFINLLIPIMN